MKTIRRCVVILLVCGGVTAWTFGFPSQGATQEEDCSLFLDYWEDDFIFDDTYHISDGYGDPEDIWRWGEWELDGAVWADGRKHSLAAGWTLDGSYAHHAPCGPR